MTHLRKALAKAVLDGDERRADTFRKVIDHRVRAAQAKANEFLHGGDDAA